MPNGSPWGKAQKEQLNSRALFSSLSRCYSGKCLLGSAQNDRNVPKESKVPSQKKYDQEKVCYKVEFTDSWRNWKRAVLWPDISTAESCHTHTRNIPWFHQGSNDIQSAKHSTKNRQLISYTSCRNKVGEDRNEKEIRQFSFSKTTPSVRGCDAHEIMKTQKISHRSLRLMFHKEAKCKSQTVSFRILAAHFVLLFLFVAKRHHCWTCSQFAKHCCMDVVCYSPSSFRSGGQNRNAQCQVEVSLRLC